MNEDEYIEDENNENDVEESKESSPYTLPDGVIERLTQYANRVGKGLQDVIDEFLLDINKGSLQIQGMRLVVEEHSQALKHL